MERPGLLRKILWLSLETRGGHSEVSEGRGSVGARLEQQKEHKNAGTTDQGICRGILPLHATVRRRMVLADKEKCNHHTPVGFRDRRPAQCPEQALLHHNRPVPLPSLKLIPIQSFIFMKKKLEQIFHGVILLTFLKRSRLGVAL